jgi:hypothetical protein
MNVVSYESDEMKFGKKSNCVFASSASLCEIPYCVFA